MIYDCITHLGGREPPNIHYCRQNSIFHRAGGWTLRILYLYSRPSNLNPYAQNMHFHHRYVAWSYLHRFYYWNCAVLDWAPNIMALYIFCEIVPSVVSPRPLMLKFRTQWKWATKIWLSPLLSGSRRSPSWARRSTAGAGAAAAQCGPARPRTETRPGTAGHPLEIYHRSQQYYIRRALIESRPALSHFC